MLSEIKLDMLMVAWYTRQKPEKRARIWTIKVPTEYHDCDILCFAIPKGTLLEQYKNDNGTKTCKQCMQKIKADNKFCFLCGRKQ